MVDRERLDEIINLEGKKNWWVPNLFVENIQKLLPKELEILSIPPPKDENYNCFIYALGLSDDKNLIKKTNGFIYDTFFQKLIDENFLLYTSRPKDGDYILYKNVEHPGGISHIGIVDGDCILSKWSWGPLVRHKIYDVPKIYGNDISYVKHIDNDEAKRLYMEYQDFNKKPES